jgi:hypothetical protein
VKSSRKAQSKRAKNQVLRDFACRFSRTGRSLLLHGGTREDDIAGGVMWALLLIFVAAAVATAAAIIE